MGGVDLGCVDMPTNQCCLTKIQLPKFKRGVPEKLPKPQKETSFQTITFQGANC